MLKIANAEQRVRAGSRCYVPDKQKSVDHTFLFWREEHRKVDHQMKRKAAMRARGVVLGGGSCKHVRDQRGKRAQFIPEL